MKRSSVPEFMRLLQNYVQAEVDNKVREQEPDSMGAYYEQQALEQFLLEEATEE